MNRVDLNDAEWDGVPKSPDSMPEAGIWVGESKFLMRVGWDDAPPHLPPEEIKLAYQSTPPYLRHARAYGLPVAGESRIYPVDPSQLWVNPFRIPARWPRAFALDPSFHFTAALWAALDSDTETWYFYSEYGRPAAPPFMHGVAVRARGDWIPGLVDPFYFGRADHADPALMTEQYKRLGLDVREAERLGVSAGVMRTYAMMEAGQIKFFRGMLPMTEFQMGTYVADPKTGKPDKKRGNDDFMDCLRIIVMGGAAIAKTKQQAQGAGPRRMMRLEAADEEVGF